MRQLAEMAMPNLLLTLIIAAGCRHLAVCSKSACIELMQESCAVDLGDQNGDLNMLQAKKKKRMGDKVLKLDRSPSMGKDSCRCIGSDGLAGTYNFTIDGKNVLYPQNAGSSCQAWEKEAVELCRKDDAPDWCTSKWCYIDPCKCSQHVPARKSALNATLQGKQLYWSYATCGGADDVAEDNSELLESRPAFCLADASEVRPDAPVKIVRSDEASAGSDGCQCIGLDNAGEVSLTVDNETVQYPAAFGTSCQAWDQGRYPGDCKKADPPDWCRSKWCYVDPCNCDLAVPPKKSITNFTFRGKTAFWSYATCGSGDSFSADDPNACVRQPSRDLCRALPDCAWDNTRCLGQELVATCGTVRKHEEVHQRLEKRRSGMLYGLSTCRCIGIDRKGYLNLSMAGNVSQYPATVGSKCSAWDNMTYAACKQDTPPEWCSKKWCYVDPCSCQLPDAQPKQTVTTALFRGQLAYLSYATCGGEDNFSVDLQSLPAFPPAFCGTQSEARTQAPLVGLTLLALAMIGSA
mmetsp:Transcript_29272/g.53955  ORF Transcript_29272/g.53955 Transcript_29272/m.53955 type:complete len:520 (+) Transcript_29272:85-1644(+)